MLALLRITVLVAGCVAWAASLLVAFVDGALYVAIVSVTVAIVGLVIDHEMGEKL